MAKMGRPRIDLDFNESKTDRMFREMCQLQCTQEEIAGVFGVSPDTLSARLKEAYGATFSEIFKGFSAGGKMSLRRSQFKLAERSAAMAIFLGKNYLNQVDVKTLDDINKPINITWSDAGDKVSLKVPPTKSLDQDQ